MIRPAVRERPLPASSAREMGVSWAEFFPFFTFFSFSHSALFGIEERGRGGGLRGLGGVKKGSSGGDPSLHRPYKGGRSREQCLRATGESLRHGLHLCGAEERGEMGMGQGPRTRALGSFCELLNPAPLPPPFNGRRHRPSLVAVVPASPPPWLPLHVSGNGCSLWEGENPCH